MGMFLGWGGIGISRGVRGGGGRRPPAKENSWFDMLFRVTWAAKESSWLVMIFRVAHGHVVMLFGSPPNNKKKRKQHVQPTVFSFFCLGEGGTPTT